MYVPLLLFAYTVVQNRNMKREKELEQIKADVIEEIQSKQEEEEAKKKQEEEEAAAKKKQDKEKEEKAGNTQKENLKSELYRIKKRFESQEDLVVVNSIVTLIFAGIIYLNILFKNIQIKNMLES